MLPFRPWLRLRGSLPAKLALAALIFVATVAGVHVFSLDRLVHAGAVSGEVRNRWIDSLRILGQLGEPVADLRAAEADILLVRDAARRESRLAALPNLMSEAATAIGRYQALPHDPDETLIFDAFLKSWAEHSNDVQRFTSLSRGGQDDAALSLFDGAARSTYEAATNELRQLADLTETKAETARDRAAQAVASAERWISDLIFGIAVLFVLLAGYLWWSVSRPLLELAGLMRRLASNQTDFSIRFDHRRDEIGEMARALAVFRSNTIELLESRKRLSNQAEVLVRSLDKERALATEQRNFISTISHEFRTPLMAIDGHAQRLIMTRDRANPPEVADRAQKIRSAVFRMTSLVGSLVNAVELAHGELPKRIRPFDLREMLQDLTRYYDGIGIGRGLQAQLGDLPAVMIGDPQLLYQVFSNVISNAFKYSPEDGIVSLSADSKEGFVEVKFEDRGLGIPRDELDRIREPYYRASNVGSIPGTGMGLHLVNEIVRQHGGRLEIESDEGRGTRVVVILPAKDPGGPAEPTSEHDPVRGGRSRDGEPARGGSERTRLLG